MEVQVGHGLSRCGPGRADEVHAFWSQSILQRYPNMYDDLKHGVPKLMVEQEEVLNVAAWDDESVPEGCGRLWEEGDTTVRLVDDGGFGVAACDATEVAIGLKARV